MRELAEEVILDLEEKASEKEISLHVTGDDAVFYTDDLLLERAIYNLVDNAIKYNTPGGVEAVVELAEKSLADDKKKALRYALGKEFAKYENAKFETVCAAYIKSADVATKATGLDIYKKNRFTSVLPLVQSIAEEEKPSSIRSKAKALLDSAQ